MVSIAIPVAFVAYADHVKQTTGVNWLGALGALVAVSIVIADHGHRQAGVGKLALVDHRPQDVQERVVRGAADGFGSGAGPSGTSWPARAAPRGSG